MGGAIWGISGKIRELTSSPAAAGAPNMRKGKRAVILRRQKLLILLLFVTLPVLIVGCGSVDTEKEDQKAVNDRELTEEQREMVELWERHTASEFETKSIDATMATMTLNPFVNHVPVMTGGVGDEEVRAFYSTYFIPGQPPDTKIEPVARTIGKDRIVDELIHKFTHTMEMPWMLPGVPPTGRRVEIPVIVVVQFENGKIAGERIYWDQASVLAQIGLIDADRLPVTGIEASQKVVDTAQKPSNGLIDRVSG